MKKIIFAVALFAVLLLAGCTYSVAELNTFAKCLAADNVTMYGAYWCPHCAKVKKDFGSSFQYMNYVECDPNGPNQQAQLCVQKNATTFPTFIFANENITLRGEITLQVLSDASGCPLPKK